MAYKLNTTQTETLDSALVNLASAENADSIGTKQIFEVLEAVALDVDLKEARKIVKDALLEKHAKRIGVTLEKKTVERDIPGWLAINSRISWCVKVLDHGDYVPEVLSGEMTVAAAYKLASGSKGNGSTSKKKTIADHVNDDITGAIDFLAGNHNTALSDGSFVNLLAIERILKAVPTEQYAELGKLLASVLPDEVLVSLPELRAQYMEAQRKLDAENAAREAALAELAEMEAEFKARREARAAELGITPEFETVLAKSEDGAEVVKVVAESA